MSHIISLFYLYLILENNISKQNSKQIQNQSNNIINKNTFNKMNIESNNLEESIFISEKYLKNYRKISNNSKQLNQNRSKQANTPTATTPATTTPTATTPTAATPAAATPTAATPAAATPTATTPAAATPATQPAAATPAAATPAVPNTPTTPTVPTAESAATNPGTPTPAQPSPAPGGDILSQIYALVQSTLSITPDTVGTTWLTNQFTGSSGESMNPKTQEEKEEMRKNKKKDNNKGKNEDKSEKDDKESNVDRDIMKKGDEEERDLGQDGKSTQNHSNKLKTQDSVNETLQDKNGGKNPADNDSNAAIPENKNEIENQKKPEQENVEGESKLNDEKK